MIKEGLEYLLSTGKKLADVTQYAIDGRTYTNKEIQPVKPPVVAALTVRTLAGLSDLLGAAFEQFKVDSELVHIVGHDQVQVIGKSSDVWQTRRVLVDCKLPDVIGFKFGEFMRHEPFIIGLLSCFAAGENDRDYLVRIASSLTSEQVVTSDDDGIGQRVGLKAGVTLKETEVLKGRVQLQPFRTFRELTQPKSEFVFRVKQDGENIPTLALFEADGGKWKIDAVEEIARHLRTILPKDTLTVS